MKQFFTLLTVLIYLEATCQQGGISISPNGTAPDTTAALDVNFNNKGVLIPRISTTQRNAINNPANSLMIFNTTTNCFEFYASGNWTTLGCGCNPPGQAGNITGASTVCQGQNNVSYSIGSVVNAIGYVWSLPAGATIVSGSNTNSIVVNYSTIATSGNISVYGYSSSCGNGATSANFPVTVNPLPEAAGTISGPGTICQGQNGVSYSIAPINYATSYTWSYSGSGASILGTGNPVAINFSNTAGSGILTVSGTNACGNGIVSANYPLTYSPLPGAAGPINGSSTPCANSTGNVYSISSVSDATSYNWTIPNGASITANTGTSITVSFGSSSGSISVTPVNSCGSGVSNDISISLNTPPNTPGPVTGYLLASSTGNVYSISSVFNTSFYKWTIAPGGASITAGQGSNSITVSYPAVTTAYSLCVYDSNVCGSSSSNCISVTAYSGRQAFSYTGSNQTFNVPNGVSSLFLKMWAAGGSGGINYSGGAGAFVSGVLSVTPNSSLTVIVGGKGTRAVGTGTAAGGFGGGGASGAGNNVNSFVAGSGGGRSAVQITPGTDAATAGGGGGCGTGNNMGSWAGGGGAPNGAAGEDNNTGTQGGPGAGKGGTTTGGGAATTASPPAVNSSAGSSQTGSAGASAPYAGGGGGGGYYGGSGGAGSTDMTQGHSNGGGGGGSSYTSNLTSVTNIAGNNGDQSFTTQAPNNTDIDYVNGVGIGGYYSNNGGNGLVIIYW